MPVLGRRTHRPAAGPRIIAGPPGGPPSLGATYRAATLAARRGFFISPGSITKNSGYGHTRIAPVPEPTAGIHPNYTQAFTFNRQARPRYIRQRRTGDRSNWRAWRALQAGRAREGAGRTARDAATNVMVYNSIVFGDGDNRPVTAKDLDHSFGRAVESAAAAAQAAAQAAAAAATASQRPAPSAAPPSADPAEDPAGDDDPGRRPRPPPSGRSDNNDGPRDDDDDDDDDDDGGPRAPPGAGAVRRRLPPLPEEAPAPVAQPNPTIGAGQQPAAGAGQAMALADANRTTGSLARLGAAVGTVGVPPQHVPGRGAQGAGNTAPVLPNNAIPDADDVYDQRAPPDSLRARARASIEHTFGIGMRRHANQPNFNPTLVDRRVALPQGRPGAVAQDQAPETVRPADPVQAPPTRPPPRRGPPGGDGDDDGGGDGDELVPVQPDDDPLGPTAIDRVRGVIRDRQQGQQQLAQLGAQAGMQMGRLALNTGQLGAQAGMQMGQRLYGAIPEGTTDAIAQRTAQLAAIPVRLGFDAIDAVVQNTPSPRRALQYVPDPRRAFDLLPTVRMPQGVFNFRGGPRVPGPGGDDMDERPGSPVHPRPPTPTALPANPAARRPAVIRPVAIRPPTVDPAVTRSRTLAARQAEANRRAEAARQAAEANRRAEADREAAEANRRAEADRQAQNFRETAARAFEPPPPRPTNDGAPGPSRLTPQEEERANMARQAQNLINAFRPSTEEERAARAQEQRARRPEVPPARSQDEDAAAGQPPLQRFRAQPAEESPPRSRMSMLGTTSRGSGAAWDRTASRWSEVAGNRRMDRFGIPQRPPPPAAPPPDDVSAETATTAQTAVTDMYANDVDMAYDTGTSR